MVNNKTLWTIIGILGAATAIGGIAYWLYKSGKKEAVNIDVTGASVDPKVINPGEILNVSVSVKNIGNVSGNWTITPAFECDMPYQFFALSKKSVTLGPGQTTSLNWSEPSPTNVGGTFGLLIYAEPPVNNYEVTGDAVHIVGQGKIEIINATLNPTSVSRGDSVTVTVSAKNTGTAAVEGWIKPNFEKNGDSFSFSQKDVVLNAGQTQVFTWTEPVPSDKTGTFNLVIYSHPPGSVKVMNKFLTIT